MVKKIIVSIAVIMLVLSFVNINKVNATDFGSIVSQANDWVNKGSSGAKIDASDIAPSIIPIAKALTTIGVGVVLVVAAIMGIKWITANPEEQAKLKQQSIGLVVAAAVVLGAYTIWSIVLKIVANL